MRLKRDGCPQTLVEEVIRHFGDLRRLFGHKKLVKDDLVGFKAKLVDVLFIV